MAFTFPDPSIQQEFTAPNGVTYSWDPIDEKWYSKSSPPVDGFVKKEGGDSMEGPLTIKAQDPTDVRATKRVETLGVFSNSDNSALRLGTTRDRVYVGHNDVSINGPVKVGEIQEKSNGNGIKVSNTLTMSDNKLTGLPEAVDDSDAVPLVQLLDNVSTLQNEIVELEEEIDAIAPSVERGQFISTTYSNAPRDGEFMLATLTRKTVDYGDPDITLILFSKVDNEGVAHTYADVEDGELIQLFEEGNDSYGLYLIEGIDGNDDPSQTAVTFTVSPVSGFGEATEGDLARLKIFKAPEGGTADGFVMKTGDTMTGPLNIDAKSNPSASGTLFSIEGDRADGQSGDRLLEAKTNATNGDQIKYYGPITNDDEIVTKQYVDDKVDQSGGSEGGCINVNGGLLCAGDVHPKFMDTLRDSSLVKVYKLNDTPGLDLEGFTFNGNVDSENAIYRTNRNQNDRNKYVYKTNYVTSTQEQVGKIYGNEFYNNDYTKRTEIRKGTLSHDQKYAIIGTKFGGYSPGGPHDHKTQYIYVSQLNTDTYWNMAVTSGRTGNHYPFSMVSTGPRTDAESGYMIASFYASGRYNSTDQHNHKISVYRYGDRNITKEIRPSSLFGYTSAWGEICRGNPKYDEVFVVSRGSTRTPIFKVQFGDAVADTNFVEHTPKDSCPENIRQITYLPKSKRYYMGGNTKGYLTQPYDGPLDDQWFRNTIEVEIPRYTAIYKGSDPYEMNRYNADVAPFEFGSEIVLFGYTGSRNMVNPIDTTDQLRFYNPQAVMIFDGGTEFKKYESNVPAGQDDDWDGDDFGWTQTINYSYFDANEVDSVSQHYGTQSVRTQKDVEFLTPGINQPYTQPLYWNNQLVEIEQPGEIEVDNLDFTKELVTSTYGIDTSVTLLTRSGTVVDGFAYASSNSGPVSSNNNYKYIWFSNKWITDRFEELDITNAFDAKVVSMSGSLASTDTLGDFVTSSRGVPFKYNNIDGILVNLSSEIRYNKLSWRISMPSAYQVFLAYSEVDPLIQIDLS